MAAWLGSYPQSSDPNRFLQPPWRVYALRISREGEVRDADPLVVAQHNTPAYALRAARTSTGVALAWLGPQMISGAIFTGAPNPPVREWSYAGASGTSAFSLAPRPGGGALLLWTAQPNQYTSSVVLREIDESGTPLDAQLIMEFERNALSPPVFTALGAQLVLAYGRRVDDPSVGGVQRIFLRTTAIGKGRAIR